MLIVRPGRLASLARRLGLLGVVACAACATRPAASPASSPSIAKCEVWAREVDFARAVREHDAAAFADHVQQGAVFVTGDALLRGRAAVTSSWSAILRGEDLRLSWYPTEVIPTGDPRVVLSRGPYWIEIVKPGATRFLKGTFQSVWVKDSDGAWRVAIDGGTPPPVPATEGEVVTMKGSAPAKCPSETSE